MDKSEILKYDVIIIGGGAAGMMTAITAGRRGKSVLVIESQEAVGRKLSVTGNGRCNITHDPIDPSFYHTDMPKRLETVMSGFSRDDIRKLFEGIGVSLYNKDGYVYPRSNEARSVVRCMELAMEEAGVSVETDTMVYDIKKDDEGFLVYAKYFDDEVTYLGSKLVITCGGMAGIQFGGSGSGLKLATDCFGLRIADPFPALTELYCEGIGFKKIKGVRALGKASVIMDDDVISESVGELQFTDHGISGIPVFNISYEAVLGLRLKKEIMLRIDLFPEMDEEMLLAYINYRFSIGRRSVEEALLGLLPEKLVFEILKTAGLSGKKAGRVSDEEKSVLLGVLKSLTLKVTGYGDYTRSQVMAGGVLLHDLKDTLESDHVPGLYFAGEMVNVDGICGGYNLHWAWCSGMTVGNEV